MASDSLSLWLNFILSRRYGVTVQGDPMPGADQPGPYMILSNNPGLIDPLLVYSRFAHLNPRPVLDHDGLRALRAIASKLRPLKKSPDDADGSALASGAAHVLNSGENVLIWPAGRLQTAGVDVLEGRGIVHDILVKLHEQGHPLPEMVLVRVEGMWGSRFSCYSCGSDGPALTGTMARLLPCLCLGPLLPRRHISIVLRRYQPLEADLAGPERINDLLSGWFNARQHSASIVPVIPGMASHNMPLVPREGEPKKAEPIPKPAPPGPIPPAQPKPDVPDLIDQGIAEKLAATQAAQAAQKEEHSPEFLLKKVKLAMPPRLPVHLAATRHGDVWDGAAGHIFSRRDILSFSKALTRKIEKDAPKESQMVAIALPAGPTAMAAFLACLDQGAIPLFLPPAMNQEAWQGWAGKVALGVVCAEELPVLPDTISPVLWEDFGKSDLRVGYMSSFAGPVGTEDTGTPAAALPVTGSGDFVVETVTHETLLVGLEALGAALTANNVKEISIFAALAPHTMLGLLAGVVMPLACGLPVACAPKQLLARTVSSCGCNVFVGNAEILRHMLETAENTLPLRCVILDKDGAPEEAMNLLRQKCPEVAVLRAEAPGKFIKM